MLRDYFALNPQSASPQLIKENEQLQELLVKKWLERDFYAFSHQKQLLENVLVEVIQGKIDYLNYIPHDARLIMLGEIHEQDWMAGSAENAVLQFKQAYPDKNIYYVSEFIDAVPEQGIYLLSKEKEVEALVNKRPYYRPMTKRMIAAGVRVVGLENPEISTELARIGYTQNFPNTQLAWKTISPSGMRERNMYWEKIIRRIYAQDPDAVVFVHAGFGHTNYNQPKALSILLKDLQPFVVEYAAPGVGDFNTLLERNIPLPPETLAKGKQLNEDTHSYYVRYVDDKTPEFSVVQRQMFKNFAITDIIEVKAEDMLSFYSFITKTSDEAGQLQKTDNLSEFTGFQFLQLESTSRENIEYLFFTSHIWPKQKSKQIVLPGFFIHRDETQHMVNSIKNSAGHFHVLRGGRLSGKTYALIDLLQVFNTRKTYYFSSNRQIADQCFEHLLRLKDAILIFDEHSLSGDQLGKITSKYREIIQKNRIQVITAIDRSAGMFTRHYFERFPEMDGFVKIYSLPSVLGEEEVERFNSEFGNLGIIDYENGWSFLDFMLKVDDASTQKHGVRLPNINVIQNLQTLKALILFANQERIPISQGNLMGITETLYNLCKTADVAVQKDYLSEVELDSNDHDSFCFVVNSKYWVYKCLSTYATNQDNYNLIAEAYYEIVNTIQHQHSGHRGQSYYQAVKPYYFFDTIQFTFFQDQKQVGSLFLPDVIYKKLLPLFKDDFQFLHQKAKCILWNSKRKRNLVGRALMLNEALQQITRAIRIVEKRNPINMEYTLYHMKVTKTLILVNNWRYCQTQFEEAELSEQLSSLLKMFYDMIQDMLRWGDDSELDDREMEDLKWFVSQLATSEVRQKMLDRDRKMAGHILTLWQQRR